jgi:hypothetical protein
VKEPETLEFERSEGNLNFAMIPEAVMLFCQFSL